MCPSEPGLLFVLQTYAGKMAPALGTLQPSCHYGESVLESESTEVIVSRNWLPRIIEGYFELYGFVWTGILFSQVLLFSYTILLLL